MGRTTVAGTPPDALVPMHPSGGSSAFRPDIEGLRAIAILMVVAFHCDLPVAPGGFLGVDVFFVLSGYLITGLLVREFAATGRIDLLDFYARRVRRLLPAAALMLVVTVLVGAYVLAPNEMLFMARAARATAIYGSNLFFAANASNYFSPEVESNPLLHTWSLAVEEQFFLFWPAFLLLCLRQCRSRLALGAVLASLSIVALILSVALTDRIGTFAFYGLPSRIWQFGAGALACLMPAGRIRASDRAWSVLGWAGLAAILASAVFNTERMEFPSVAATVPIVGAIAVLLVGAEHSGAGAARLLAMPSLLQIGKLSYSWYLWHWPFVVYAQALVPSISRSGKVVASLIALLTSFLTYRWVENPVRFNPTLIRRRGVSIAVGAILMVACFALSLKTAGFALQLSRRPQMRAILSAIEDVGRLSRKRCVAFPEVAVVKSCDFGDVNGTTQVVLFGDSHAMQWFNPLQRIAERQHWRLTTYVKMGCPSIDLRPPSPTARAFTSCRVWQKEAIARVIDLRPAAVFVSNATGRFGTGLFPPSHVDFDESLDDLQAATRRTLQQLSAAAVPVVLMLDPPLPGFDVPTCHARSIRHPWYPGGGCVFERSRFAVSDTYDAQRAAAAGLADIHFIDMVDRLCGPQTCATKHGDRLMYRDRHHLTASFAESLTNELERDLLADVASLRPSH
jgi:peptidoglycan/LPS O-acetylase OafA/YrhL